MTQGIKGKRTLITGASGGIGSCLANLLASKGAVVGIHYHQNKKEAESIAQKIINNGGTAECFQADFLKEEALGLVDSFVERFKGIDALINNAGGVFGFKHFKQLDNESWRKTNLLNAEVPFFLARSAFAYMQENGGGKIINISSVAAKYGGSPQTIHYGAAKAGLEACAIGLARFGAQYNILVNCIRGGFIDTPFHQKLDNKNIEERIKLIPLKRAGKPEDIAQMACFLLSNAGDFITGETFSVSGGD